MTHLPSWRREGNKLVFPGRTGAVIDLDDEWFEPSTADIMPRKPSGDQREKTVTEILRDGISEPAKKRYEEDLRKSPGGVLFGANDIAGAETQALGEILVDHYFVRTTKQNQFLFPYQAGLPANYVYKARYKMFNGSILAFLCRTGPPDYALDRDLVDRFYTLFNETAGLTLADRLFLEIALRPEADPPMEPGKTATADRLEQTAKLDCVPHYFPEAVRLFRHDLDTALRISSFGRRDHVHAVLTVLFLHIALYYWRAGWELENQVKALSRFFSGDVAAAEVGDASAGSFGGQVKFRVPLGHIRPVKRSDPAARSYTEVNDHRLLLLPLNISLLRLMRSIVAATGRDLGLYPSFADMAAAIESDDGLAVDVREALAQVARARASALGGSHPADTEARLSTSGQEFSACREVLLSAARSDLRRYSRDITAAVMKRGGRGLMHTRGNVGFFEMGQDLLLLVARLAVRDKNTAVPFKEVLRAFHERGLAPQDRPEEHLLAEALRNLNVLEKHADAGEAMYVRHFL